MHPLFNSQSNAMPVANTKNLSGGKAYSISSQVALAKYASTGTFGDTYQVSAETQLDKVLEWCKESDPTYIAKVAIYSRLHSGMKDVPAFLVAYLSRHHIDLCKQVFPRVINDPKMLRNVIQIIRSGTITPSRSLGTATKRLVCNYLNSLTNEQLFRADVGNKPSLPDIIKMMHPRPNDKTREALYAYLIGKEPKPSDKDYLLPLAREFEAFKKDMTLPVPNVPFQMLTALSLTPDNWKTIARNATFNQVRQNLETFERHGVLKDKEIVDHLAAKLSDPEEVRRSKVMPYQLMTTFMNVDVHPKLHNALQAAMEIAIENVPKIDEHVVIGVDVSGSMCHKLTGKRAVSTKVRYVDVAALFASAILRVNKNAVILPFDTEVRKIDLNPFDSVITNAQKLAIRGGATDCSVPLRELNDRKEKADVFIIISDNESYRAYAGKRYGNRTTLMHEWSEFVKRNPNSKMINIDISPSDTTQMANVKNTMLCGGFNDAVFDVVSGFLRDGGDDYWIKTINEIKL